MPKGLLLSSTTVCMAMLEFQENEFLLREAV
jgi:hypothetical protein